MNGAQDAAVGRLCHPDGDGGYGPSLYEAARAEWHAKLRAADARFLPDRRPWEDTLKKIAFEQALRSDLPLGRMRLNQRQSVFQLVAGFARQIMRKYVQREGTKAFGQLKRVFRRLGHGSGQSDRQSIGCVPGLGLVQDGQRQLVEAGVDANHRLPLTGDQAILSGGPVFEAAFKGAERFFGLCVQRTLSPDEIKADRQPRVVEPDQ